MGYKENNIYAKSKIIPKKYFIKGNDSTRSTDIKGCTVSRYIGLERKIDSITNGLSRPYFNKILKELARKNLDKMI